MAEVPSDLINYSYDPSAPLPTGKESRDHVISKGPCQPKNISFPEDKRKRKFSASWHGTINLSDWNIQPLRIKHFVSIVESLIPRY